MLKLVAKCDHILENLPCALATKNHCVYNCLLSKFQLDILKGSQDIVNLISNTLQTNFHSNTLSSKSD